MVSSGRIEGAAAMLAAFALGVGADRGFALVAGGGEVVALGAAAGGLVCAAGALWHGRRRRAFDLARERSARDAVEARMQHMTRHDALTGLLNRTVFVEHLRGVLAGSRRKDRMVAVLTLDLRDFKAINETYGHAAGDLLLRHAAARLLSNLRDTDLLARMSGDEFAIVLADIPGPDAASSLADRLMATIAEPFDLMGQAVLAQASVGIAMHPADGAEPDALLQRSGLALQRAKQTGAGSTAFFEPGMDARVQRRKRLELDLHHALERGQLDLHYQPQIDLGSRRIVGVEALARWFHPEHGPVPPDVFIPLAEDCGLIGAIGAWALERACAQARAWQLAGSPELRISVNLSPLQFRDADLAGTVAAVLERTGLAPRHLELEITERLLIEDSPQVRDTLERLRAAGVRIAVDDFGVGHASLSYLRQFVFDEIKLDRAFVGALERSPSAAAILRAALSLSRSLDMGLIAEGVETRAQLDLLLTEGCTVAQGYYFSPPQSAAEIDILIRSALASAAEADQVEDAKSVA